MYVCMYVSVYVCTSIDICMRMCLYARMCVYVCVPYPYPYPYRYRYLNYVSLHNFTYKSIYDVLQLSFKSMLELEAFTVSRGI